MRRLAVKDEKVDEVRRRLSAARDSLQEAIHVLDAAGVLDDEDRLTYGALGADIGRALEDIDRAREEITSLCLSLIGEGWMER